MKRVRALEIDVRVCINVSVAYYACCDSAIVVASESRGIGRERGSDAIELEFARAPRHRCFAPSISGRGSLCSLLFGPQLLKLEFLLGAQRK